ncbi:MAG: UDP-N-acetylglucosamine 1-carboxyvinyltransferase [Bacillota bacterium]
MGGNRLVGKISVGGAKNSVLPIMAAALLAEGKTTIENVPYLSDVEVMKEVLRHAGAVVEHKHRRLEVEADKIQTSEIPETLTRKLRASNLVMGALLARMGKANVAYPGGCSIGSRPLDLHLKGLQLLGAEIKEKGGFIQVRASQLVGADIHLDFPSVGATENLMLAAVLAKGTTVIRNAAKEPEIVDLQNFLNAMGAHVRGAGVGTIVVKGVKSLRGTKHEVIPDRIEVATYMIASAITQGDVSITNAIPEHVEPVIAKLRETGAEVIVERDTIRVCGPSSLKSVNIKTLPYPGFPTDVQPQMMTLLTISQGASMVTETIFENRFKHAAELRRMGADITLEGRVALIKGVPRLSGAFVEATDLRAGVALVLAGLVAEGITVVENISHILRGYECIDRKLNQLGAKIVCVET